MNDTVIYVEKLSKKYMIGALQNRQDTMRDVIVDGIRAGWQRTSSILGFKKNIAGHTKVEHSIWALKDVSLEVKRGDVVGIIGRNGAGKSTLLKILSRITEPTEGRAILDGRVASLLEVGTGFHPELTGRENIYLNGTILGMSKLEIDRKFDEIVDFSEIEQFLDTPVKRYSSGMYVRLAFAVAAHLEPEILIVDEVLAVGDAEFQKKCLGKMDNVAREGRTVLFVSHNMNAIQRLCPQCLLFERGQLILQGPTDDIVAHYLSSSFFSSIPGSWNDLVDAQHVGTQEAYFDTIAYKSDNPTIGYGPYSNGPLEFDLAIESNAPRTISSIAVTIYDVYGTKLVNADIMSLGQSVALKEGRNEVKIKIKKLHLSPGTYVVGLWMANATAGYVFDYILSAIHFDVVDITDSKFGVRIDGAVTCDFEFIHP